MLLKISWRNIFRHPVRSLIIGLAVALGLWAGIIVMALSSGLLKQQFDMMISNYISHVQLHHPSFSDERDVKYQVPKKNEVFQKLKIDNRVKAFAPRTLVFGFAASAAGSRGVEIRGVDPLQEENLTNFSGLLTEGNFLKGEYPNPLVISERLAKILNVEKGSRMVLTFQNLEGDIVSAAFRVEALYRTADVKMDERFVYARITDIGELLGEDMVVNEIAVLLNDIEKVDDLTLYLKQDNPNTLIRTWYEISPQLLYMNEISSQMIYIFIIIILIGLAFGILNTMQMAVFERIRELAMLKAIGMNKTKVFSMIMLETVFLSMCGGIAGIVFGMATVNILNKRGLNFSAFADALATFGMDAVIYPTLASESYLILLLMVFLTAVLAAIYPAIKAINTNPADVTKN
jgi:putative ABC transport system permease protein